MLSNLVPMGSQQTDHFGFRLFAKKSDKLMDVFDTINMCMGKHAVRIASQGYKQLWKMKQEHKSQCFMTRCEEILEAG